MRAVIETYSEFSKKDFEQALKSEMSGDLLRSFLAVSKFTCFGIADQLNSVRLDFYLTDCVLIHNRGFTGHKRQRFANCINKLKVCIVMSLC